MHVHNKSGYRTKRSRIYLVIMQNSLWNNTDRGNRDGYDFEYHHHCIKNQIIYATQPSIETIRSFILLFHYTDANQNQIEIRFTSDAVHEITNVTTCGYNSIQKHLIESPTIPHNTR